MKAENDKTMTDFMRLIQAQDFESENDVEKFMNEFLGKKITNVPKGVLTKKEQAQDLIFECYDLPPEKVFRNIEKALKLDIDCLEAYELLGLSEESEVVAMVFYEKAVTVGRKVFNEEYIQEHKGMFWGLHETRPFMRCLYEYSNSLCSLGMYKEGVEIFEEMIELNPNDNQGVRDVLMLYLIHIEDYQKYFKYAERYKDCDWAISFFNDALYAFKTEGDSKNANAKLAKAVKANKHISKKLLATKPPIDLPEFFTIGDENEASFYADFAYKIWKETDGARDWLKKMTVKKK
jgi:tetratricopeptide (TPR) repeat protein